MKKMGRPKGNNNKDVSYTIRMDSTTHKRLEEYCILMNKPKSEVIRDAINKYVDESKIGNTSELIKKIL